jgi:hypothetical protein
MLTSTGRSSTARRWVSAATATGTALVAALAVTSTAGAATSSAPANGPIGASGSIAALAASSMEVQNPNSGQTTVNWTSTTTFSKTAKESVSSITAGDCVTVTGTVSKKSKTTIAARSITVDPARSDGSCFPAAGTTRTAGPGFGGGFFRSGQGAPGEGGNTTRPSFPSGPSGPGSFRARLASMSFASGKVTAAKGSTLTVSGLSLSLGSFPRPAASSNSGKGSTQTKKPVTPKKQTLKITTSASTTVSATQSAAATDLAVGDCVNAFGPAASNGSITATTVHIASTGGASCTTGFGRFGGGGAFGGPGGFPGPGAGGGSGA